jgi:RNA ligase (TIGR02306 family)
VRQLVTVRTIAEVSPIEGADAIEKVRVDGWWCVTKKNEFRVGDSCLYFEVDSLLPCIEQFKFLEGRGRSKMIHEGRDIEGYRLRTVKLKGQISQGLCLPLSMFDDALLLEASTGQDLASIIGVIKYEPPVPAGLGGEVKGAFPAFVNKTDEERLQNLPDVIQMHQHEFFTVTEKLDGTSATFYKHNGCFGVCGRNWEYKDTPANVYWRVAKAMNLESKLPDYMAIQCEIIGEGIQGNPYKLKGHQAKCFYVFATDTGEYLSSAMAIEFCQMHNFDMVPVISKDFCLGMGLGTAPVTIDDILTMANRKSVLNPNTNAEGLVFRMNDLGGSSKVSFKAISNNYLLKHE